MNEGRGKGDNKGGKKIKQSDLMGVERRQRREGKMEIKEGIMRR